MHKFTTICSILFVSWSLCLFASAEQKLVDTAQSLVAAVKEAEPGSVILIKNGTYKDSVKLTAKGEQDRPIVVQAESIGGVVFTRPATLNGSWLTLEGVAFKDKASVTLKGNGLRLSRATFTNCQSKQWVRVLTGSKQVEIDHCLFEKKENNRDHTKRCQLLRITVNNKKERHHIHHNHFRDIPKGKAGNGYETVQLITHRNPFDPSGGDCETLIEHNLFERCNGESEIISIKSNGNIIRENTFRACRGGLVLRHGHRNVAESNWFFGEGEAGSRGIRLQGRDQRIAKNKFLQLGREAIAMMDGTPDKLYVRVERAKVEGNTMIDCEPALLVGVNHSKHPNGTAPKECEITDNLFLTEKKTGDLISYVQGDVPEQWVWKNNRYHGDLGIAEVEGFAKIGPDFKLPEIDEMPLTAEQVGPTAK